MVISVEKYHNIFSYNDETSREHNIIVYLRAMIITHKCRRVIGAAAAAATAAARPPLKTYTHTNTEDI